MSRAFPNGIYWRHKMSLTRAYHTGVQVQLRTRDYVDFKRGGWTQPRVIIMLFFGLFTIFITLYLKNNHNIIFLCTIYFFKISDIPFFINRPVAKGCRSHVFCGHCIHFILLRLYYIVMGRLQVYLRLILSWSH